MADAATLADWERAVVEGFPLAELQPFAPGCLAGPPLLGDDRWAAGVFSDMSRPGAEQHGFVPIIRFTLWRRSRG